MHSSLPPSTQPFFQCSETWRRLAAQGQAPENLPKQPATWAAIGSMQEYLLDRLEARFGVVVLTYGFAGAELVKAIRAGAAARGRLPNISPRTDQHAGHELTRIGTRRCIHDGIAVDLRVPDVSSRVVAEWVIDNLPFDCIYFYDAQVGGVCRSKRRWRQRRSGVRRRFRVRTAPGRRSLPDGPGRRTSRTDFCDRK